MDDRMILVLVVVSEIVTVQNEYRQSGGQSAAYKVRSGGNGDTSMAVAVDGL